MLFNLIGVIVAGIASAGSVMLVFRIMRRRPPGWLVPATAGLAMITFHLWNEYTWFERVAEGLPEQVVVAERYTYESALQPWTLVRPRINRFAAVDRSTIRRNEQAPGYVMADVLLVGRLDPTARITQLYDCRQARRTDVGASTNVDERGVPLDANWIDAETDHKLFRLICENAQG
jgi:hypothetical protein